MIPRWIIRSAPYLIFVCVVVGVAWGIYRAGYKSADKEWSLKWERHQGALIQANVERTNRALEAMAERHRKQARVGKSISEVKIPDTDTCTDPDWLRAHNDTVRAANGE